MVSFFTLVSSIGAFIAITVGIIISPLPKQLGFYRFVASKHIPFVGLTPAFHHGIEWQYTFEELYDYCPQIKGQTALITGANSGVGFETARALAKCGVDITMACRNPKRCAAAAEKIKEESKDTGYDNQVVTMTVDTSSLKSVQKFSQEFLAKNDKKALDMLYLNAGIGSTGGSSGGTDELVLSEDGIELIFATNYVGHHLMYKLLEPLLLKSKLARIVLTSSAASFDTFEYKVATSIEKLNSATNHDFRLYGQSKLAQIVWAKHLTKLLGENSNIYVNACHPGAVDTFIWEKGDMEYLPSFVVKFVNYLRRNVMWTTEEGALTQLFLGVATDKLVSDNIRGKFYHPQAQEVVNPLSLDEKLQKDLWEFSDALVAKFL
mmetsp:Transcript_24181/g.36018  ORF Transcript_24181/g.36018 Transcript_24181/m.36018 type:complete len:378 (+) Transcript_24181:131-1264(+)